MSLPVFLAEPGALDGARVGGRQTLTGPEAHHAAAVRRVRVGERIEIADGAGRVVRGPVLTTSPDGVTIEVDTVTDEPEPAVALVLVQALAKGDRDERAIEAATELGVDAVVPWQSERSVSVWTGAKAERGRGRWAAVVAAAAKQSRRARVPQVRPFVRGAELVPLVEGAHTAGGAVLVLHENASMPLAGATLPAAGEVLVVVGPEGGLSEAEVSALTAAGGAVVRLGPHVLRTSTAGPAALAVLSQRLGRWDAPAASR